MHLRLKIISIFLIFSTALGLVAFGRPFTAQAAACTITTTSTIDQAYIDANTCATIDLSGTITITWSGTTDLVGAGTVTVSSGTVTFSGAMVLGSTDDFTVSSGATVTHAAENTTGVDLTARNVTITGSVNVSSKGCANSKGPDASNICTNKGTDVGDTGGVGGEGGDAALYFGSGAGHGGTGGTTDYTSTGGGRYDSVVYPKFLGSGGGNGGFGTLGGYGGVW